MWIEQISSELKGDRSYDDLIWSPEPGLNIEPFYHPDDQLETPLGRPSARDAAWMPVESLGWPLQSSEIEELQALDISHYQVSLPLNDLSTLVSELSRPHMPANAAFHLRLEVGETDHSLSHLTNTSDGRIFSISIPEASTAQRSQLLDWKRQTRAKAAVVCVHASAKDTYSEQLARILTGLVDWFDLIDADEVANNVRVTVPVGRAYVAEICKIRALRLALQRLWLTYQLPVDSDPALEAVVMVGMSGQDKYSNLIATATAATSAILGGVDYLNMNYLSSDADTLHTIATKLHHVLRLECGLDRVTDPLGGSYLIEKLSHDIAEKGWKTFRERRAGR